MQKGQDRTASSTWWETEQYIPGRTQMPQPAQPEVPASLWAIIKNAVGKDLRNLPLPVELHEPITDLQKMAENCEYTELLDQAFQKPKSSIERLLLVAAYAVSPYSAAKRVRKSMYPMMGETYELVLPEKHVRYLAEMTSRRSDANAAIIEGEHWLVEIDGEPIPKFGGLTIDIHLNWDIQVTFSDGDFYNWGTLLTTVNSLMGTMYMTHTGAMHIHNRQSDCTAVVSFGDPGSYISSFASTRQTKNLKVTGHIVEKGKKLKKPTISGQWDKDLTASMPDGSDIVLWTMTPSAQDPSRFGFTTFAMKVSDAPPELASKLPRTDSRFRKDVRLLEQGRNHEASAEKARLEDLTAAQLSDAKAKKQTLEQAQPPKWFERVANPGEKGSKGKAGGIRWRYKGGYWEARKAGTFNKSTEIFG